MTVNNMVTNAHVASISGTDGTQSDRLVKKGSFLAPNVLKQGNMLQRE